MPDTPGVASAQSRQSEPDRDAPPSSARSALMARIRGKNTRPEMIVRCLVHRMGRRFRLHRGDLPGRPDLVFPAARIALFVHGCFWHRHPGCRLSSMPKTRVDFWRSKFEANIARDERVQAELRAAGWRVAVVWECETRDLPRLEARLRGEFASSTDDPCSITPGVHGHAGVPP